MLEDTAKTQAETLRQADQQWKQYRDQVSELQQRLQDTQKLVLAPASTQSVDMLMSNNQKIEIQLKQNYLMLHYKALVFELVHS